MEDQKPFNPDVLDRMQPFDGPPQVPTGGMVLSTGGAMQQVRTAYTTAVSVQRPRTMARVTQNVIAEAKLARAAFYYRWPVKTKQGKKYVQGASIDLAMCVARNYGNCVTDIEFQETQTHYLFKGVFIDLESGLTVPRLFRQRKDQNIGMTDKDRAEDITFQIGQSKAARNAILKAMPAWLIDKAIDVAIKSEIEGIKSEGIEIARAAVLDYFGQLGVTQEQMEVKAERNADNWTESDISDFRGMATGLNEGRVSIKELFPSTDMDDKAANINKDLKPDKQPAKPPPGKNAQQPRKEDKAPPKQKEEPPLSDDDVDTLARTVDAAGEQLRQVKDQEQDLGAAGEPPDSPFHFDALVGEKLPEPESAERIWLDRYLAERSELAQIPIHSFKSAACQDFEQFWSEFMEWLDIQREEAQQDARDKAGELPGSSEEEKTGGAAIEENPWIPFSKWKSKRSQGFPKYVKDNAVSLSEQDQSVIDAVKDKWRGMKLPPDGFPIITTGEGSEQDQEQDQVEDPGPGPQDPDPPPITEEPDKGSSPKNTGQTLPNQSAETVHRDKNKEYNVIFPDEWEQARKDLGFATIPATEQAATIWNKRIDELVEKKTV